MIYSSLFVNFGQDVARDAYITNQNIESKQYIVSYGPKASVWNFYLPPFYYQLHLFVSIITGQAPLTMKWFITIVESISPVLLFLILIRMTKPSVALLASCLYAFSPFVIFYSTNAWNPNLIPFFSILCLFSIIRHFQDKSKVAIIGIGLCLTVILHLHYQGVVLIPIVFWAMVKSIYTARSNIRYWFLVFIIGLISVTPYFYAEVKYDFHNTKKIVEFFSIEHSNYYDRVSKPAYLTDFIPGYFERAVRDLHTDYWLGRSILVLGLAIALGLSYKKNQAASWVLLYFLTVLIMLRLYKGDKVDYYLNTMVFIPFIFMALIMDKIKFSAVIIFALIVFKTAPIYAKQTPLNDLDDLKTKIKLLEPMIKTDTIGLLFHDDDMINVYAYGLTYLSNLHVDQNSANVLEICQKNVRCVYDGYFWCKPNQAYMYMSRLKNTLAYQQDYFQIKDQMFVISNFNSNNSNGVLPQQTLSGYGSDFIIPRAIVTDTSDDYLPLQPSQILDQN